MNSTRLTAKNVLGPVLGILTLGTAAVLVLSPCPSSADDETTEIGEVAIDHVGATPARAGETTRVTLSIENSGAERVVITGIRLPTGEPSRVMGFYGTSHSGEIGGFPVGPGETAGLDGKNTWIEIGPLMQDLPEGAAVSARLLLGTYAAPLTIHVSAPPQDQTRRGRRTKPAPDAIAGSGPTWLQAIRC